MEKDEIRMANAGDVQALLAIYAPYVTETAITFEYEVPGEPEFAKRIAQVQEKYPYLIYKAQGQTVGYAYAAPYRARAAYQWDVEVSVYLSPAAQGTGAAAALYRALFALLAAQGVYNIYACITYPNPRSERFHERQGFQRTGVFTGAGYKHSAWRDVIWFEKALRPREGAPEPILSADELDPALVRKILEEAVQQPISV